MFHTVDSLTWPECVRKLILANNTGFSPESKAAVSHSAFPYLVCQNKLHVLRALCNQFMQCAAVRNELLREGLIKHEDLCRVCQQAGHVLCCELCPATYHKECLTPPLTSVPEGDWICPFCEEIDIEGVGDCVSRAEQLGSIQRQDPLGFDRKGRRVWFLVRRLIIEDEFTGEVWYYSSNHQFKRLLSALDEARYERFLLYRVHKFKSEIVSQLLLTEKLSSLRKGRCLKTWLADYTDRLQLERNEVRGSVIASIDSILGSGGHQSDQMPSASKSTTLIETEQNDDDDDVTSHDDIDDCEQQCSSVVNSIQYMNKLIHDDQYGENAIPSNFPSISEIGQSTSAKSNAKYTLPVTSSFRSSDPRLLQQLEDACVTQEVEIRLKRCDAAMNLPQLGFDQNQAPQKPATKRVFVRRKPPKLRITRPSKVTDRASKFDSFHLFKLGEDQLFKKYVNLYDARQFAKSLPDRNRERDRARYFNQRFCTSGFGAFEWSHNVFGNSSEAAFTVFERIFEFARKFPEELILIKFVRDAFYKWQAEFACLEPNSVDGIQKMSIFLQQLQMCLRRVVFILPWFETVGQWKFVRETALEKEEKKRAEKQRREQLSKRDVDLNQLPDGSDDAPVKNIVWVKYPRGIPKHQIWKKDKEETYRVNGDGCLGGWLWVSLNRYCQLVDTSVIETAGLKSPAWVCNDGPFVDDLIVEFSKQNAEFLPSSAYIESKEELMQPACAQIPIDQSSDVENPKFSVEGAFRRLELFKHLEVVNVSLGIYRHTVFYKVGRPSRLDKLLIPRMKAYREEVFRAKNRPQPKMEALPTPNVCFSPTCLHNSDSHLLLSRLPCYVSTCPSRVSKSTMKKSTPVVDSLSPSLPYKLRLNPFGGRSRQPVMPPYPKVYSFETRTTKKMTALRLAPDLLKKLARRGGQMDDLDGFITTRTGNVPVWAWPYPCARPTMETVWRYMLQSARSISTLASLFRMFYCSIRWNDLDGKVEVVPEEPDMVISSSADGISEREVLEHSDWSAFGLRSRYLIRRVEVPTSQDGQKVTNQTVSRSGRVMKRSIVIKEFDDPSQVEKWVADRELPLPELRLYWEGVLNGRRPFDTSVTRYADQQQRMMRMADGSYISVSSPSDIDFTSVKQSVPVLDDVFAVILKAMEVYWDDSSEYFRNQLTALRDKYDNLIEEEKFGKLEEKLQFRMPSVLPKNVKKINLQEVLSSTKYQELIRLRDCEAVLSKMVDQIASAEEKVIERQQKQAHEQERLGRVRFERRLTELGCNLKREMEKRRYLAVMQVAESVFLETKQLLDSNAKPKTGTKRKMAMEQEQVANNSDSGLESVDSSSDEEESDVNMELPPVRVSTPPSPPRKKQRIVPSASAVVITPPIKEEPMIAPGNKRKRMSSGNSLASSVHTTTSAGRSVIKRQSYESKVAEKTKKLIEEIETKRERSPSPDIGPSRKKLYSEKYHCYCAQPYNPRKFYLACNLCSNWFHGSCVGINEVQARKLNEWLCRDCSKASEETKQELYCICREPYDEDRFYICCETCQEWFHGDCVEVTEEEADDSFEYQCDVCKDGNSDMKKVMLKPLKKQQFILLDHLIDSAKKHKTAWPFLEPVDKEMVPDYYNVIKEPIDLQQISNKLQKRKTYLNLQDFVSDFTRMIDNARYFNAKDSPIINCADILEKFFVDQIKIVKDSIES